MLDTVASTALPEKRKARVRAHIEVLIDEKNPVAQIVGLNELIDFLRPAGSRVKHLLPQIETLCDSIKRPLEAVVAAFRAENASLSEAGLAPLDAFEYARDFLIQVQGEVAQALTQLRQHYQTVPSLRKILAGTQFETLLLEVQEQTNPLEQIKRLMELQHIAQDLRVFAQRGKIKNLHVLDVLGPISGRLEAAYAGYIVYSLELDDALKAVARVLGQDLLQKVNHAMARLQNTAFAEPEEGRMAAMAVRGLLTIFTTPVQPHGPTHHDVRTLEPLLDRIIAGHVGGDTIKALYTGLQRVFTRRL